MAKKSPYEVIKHQYVTEKATTLANLKNMASNPSLRSCKAPKYTFLVDKSANKQDIALALEEIYKERSIKVVAVNTINVEGKAKRMRGRPGYKSSFKKAIVTLRENDSLDSDNV